jgi:hypothetical protein
LEKRHSHLIPGLGQGFSVQGCLSRVDLAHSLSN